MSTEAVARTCACGRPARPQRTQCTTCNGKASRQRRYLDAKEQRPARVTPEYAREEFNHLVRYGLQFSVIAGRLGISKGQLRANIAGKVPKSCCDGCGQQFRGSVPYCSQACAKARAEA